MPKVLISLCLLLLLLSCKNKPVIVKQEKTKNITNDTVFANYADSLFYKFAIINDYENNNYALDNHSQCTALLTNTISIDGNYFGGRDMLAKAVKHAVDTKSESVIQQIKISFRKNNGKFEEAFYFNNPASISEDGMYNGSYSIYEIEPSIQDGSVLQNGKESNCLKIIFTEKDYSGIGGHIFVLSFVRDETKWTFVSREKFSKEKNEDAYCISYDNCTEYNKQRIFIGLGACLGNGFYDTCR